MNDINRRNFIKKTSLSAAFLASYPHMSKFLELHKSNANYMGDFIAPKLTIIRAAFIGVGSRGGSHIKFFAGLPGTEIVAISDLYEDKVKEKLGWVNKIIGSSLRSNISTYWGNENQC